VHPTSQEREAAPVAFGRYSLGQEIARGTSSAVVQAFDTLLQRPVALKILHGTLAADPDRRHRFVEDAKATAELDHPGIVPVHELGELHDGRPFIAMKLLTGKNLTRILDDIGEGTVTTPSLRSLLGRFLRVCETVAYAHARGVIHRDLRPHNLVLGDFGEAYVLDWGLFKWNPSQHLLREVREGMSSPGWDGTRRRGRSGVKKVPGAALESPSPELMRLSAKLPFMSPEQVNADGLDPRSDVYGLGAILYAIACGQPPVETIADETVGELLERVRSAPRQPPSARVGAQNKAGVRASVPWAVPPAVDVVCSRALSMNREARYPNVLELIADLER